MAEIDYHFQNLKVEPSLPEGLEGVQSGQADPEEALPWLSTLIGVARNSSGAITGKCVAQLVDRPSIREHFHAEMERPSEELHQMGYKLFDETGHIKKDNYEHSLLRGSGVWGKELGDGKFLHVEYLKVEKEYRRQGIGKALIEGCLKMAEEQDCNLSFTRVKILWSSADFREEYDKAENEEAKASLEEESEANTLSFFHSLGFRRVGVTQYLARVSDASHPSRSLRPTHDADKLDVARLSPHQMQARYPLHWAVMKEAEGKCLELLHAAEKRNPNTNFRRRDRTGSTLLHAASYRAMGEVVKFLLSKEGVSEDLFSKNIQGFIPLDMLELRLREAREDKVTAYGLDMIDPMDDTDDEASYMKCKDVLDRAMGDLQMEDVDLDDSR